MGTKGDTVPALLPTDEDLFTGTYERLLDDKARVVLPPPWRDSFTSRSGGTGTVKLSRWNGRLALWTRAAFQSMLNEVRSQERIGAMPAGAYRGLVAGTTDVTVDAAGRILLPASSRSAVGIGDKGAEVTLAGLNNRIEIAATSRFDAGDPDAAARTLDELLY